MACGLPHGDTRQYARNSGNSRNAMENKYFIVSEESAPQGRARRKAYGQAA